jgi:anti-anti-sigma factor
MLLLSGEVALRVRGWKDSGVAVQTGQTGGGVSGESPPFRAEVTHPGGGDRVLTLAGEVDIETVRPLTNSLDAVLLDEPARVVVDLTQISFIDSSGVAAVLAALDKAHACGVDLRVVIPDTCAAHRVFQLIGLLDTLPAYDSVDNARSC